MSSRKFYSTGKVRTNSNSDFAGQDTSSLGRNTVLKGLALNVNQPQYQNCKSTACKEKYNEIRNSLGQARTELSSKQMIISNLQKELRDFKSRNLDYNQPVLAVSHASCHNEIEKLKKELYTEQCNCAKLKTSLSESRESHRDISAIESKHLEILSTMSKKHAEEINLLQSKHHNELKDERKRFEGIIDDLNSERSEFQNIVCSKNEQISRLKVQVAESLETNSRVRHKQIDDLVKELKLVSDEANVLKDSVGSLQFSMCEKCSFYENKYKEAVREMEVQNENCNALVAVCSKMENQLSQQDDLLALCANIKKRL